MPIITMILFYGYTALTGTHMLWADVIVFILSVIGGQVVSLLILTRTKKDLQGVNKLALAGLAVMVLAFSLLSYYPFQITLNFSRIIGISSDGSLLISSHSMLKNSQ
jgi:hypothetical protein